MKVTLNWLKQYVDFDWSPAELAERLTLLGLEVEGVEQVGGGFEGIVVAQVITRDKHPDADKLSVCRVNDGLGERQIVCGAHNFKAGDKVPLILPGATLPPKTPGEKPFTIKVGKIRGVESHGMMCSHEELVINPESIGLKQEDGLLILPESARVGQPFAEYLGRNSSDVVYDLEITPNRPDWNSVLGIAREIAALTGNPLKLPAVGTTSTSSPNGDAVERVPASDLVSVRLEAPDLCPRYTARVIKGVKVGPSPDWLRSMMEKVGLRSINNVVDVTNYVMMETGQPLHAFDYHLIAKPRAAGVSPADQTSKEQNDDRRDACPAIVVRRAQPGEAFVTLDGQKHTLSDEHLLIADTEKAIALAGVMGGRNTEINDQTVDVLLESAWFNPTNIRRTSKALGLRTDSSYRFERGADIGVCDWASQRAAQLILATAGGTLAEGVVDAYPQPAQPRHIPLRHRKVNELLGIALAPGEIEYLLGQLGLKKARSALRPHPVDGEATVEPATFEIPTFRVDLKREVDLIEEVARLHGVDRIPATAPRGAHGTNEFDAVYDQQAEARRILTGLGLHEAQGQTLVGSAECGMRSAECVRLANPLSSEMDVLRPSLLPGLLNILRHNLSRKNSDVAMFEIGRVFHQRAAGVPPADHTSTTPTPISAGVCEGWRVALALTGQRALPFWSGADRDAKFDASDLKGVLDEFLEQFGVKGVLYSQQTEPAAWFVDATRITLGGKSPLGEAGLLQPALARQYDLRDPVLLAELDLDALLARRNPARSFKPLPQFPSSRRDIAMLLPEKVTHDEVLRAVRQAKPADLESIELFDVFRGKGIPEGRKSCAYAFTYRAADRTLTDKEVNVSHDKVLAACKEQLGATVRE
jgi:phenylalanyl-tRNA synthetase beta chain